MWPAVCGCVGSVLVVQAFTAYRRGTKSAFFEINMKMKFEGECGRCCAVPAALLVDNVVVGFAAEQYSDDGEVLRSGDGEVHILDVDQDSDLAKIPVRPVVGLHRSGANPTQLFHSAGLTVTCACCCD